MDAATAGRHDLLDGGNVLRQMQVTLDGNDDVVQLLGIDGLEDIVVDALLEQDGRVLGTAVENLLDGGRV